MSTQKGKKQAGTYFGPLWDAPKRRGGPKPVFNAVRVEGDVAYLALTDRQGTVRGETMVDAADVPRLKAHGRNWGMYDNGHGGIYVKHTGMADGQRVTTYLHRFLLNAPAGMSVDHINGDGLDNRRGNLRLATTAQNNRNRGPRRDNSIGYKGVWLEDGRYRASIGHEGQVHRLGRYDTPEEAARAYDVAATVLYGAFAKLNFPPVD